MRSIVIALSVIAGLLAQQVTPARGQIPKGGGPVFTMNPDPTRVEELLNSTPGCQRHGRVSYADIAQELNSVIRNPACKNYVALARPCPPRLVWDHRYTRPLPAPLWAGYAPPSFSVGQQNVMLAQARSAAAGIAVPPGTRLYRLTFLTKNVGMGPHPTQRIMGEAHYGVCRSGIS